jgi:hypothetical protein
MHIREGSELVHAPKSAFELFGALEVRVLGQHTLLSSRTDPF